MVAATTSNSKLLAQMRKKIEGALRNLEEGTVPVLGAGIEFCFGDNFTIPTTSIDDVNDIHRLYQFPSGAYITDFRGTPTDGDTNATPTLAYSILVTDSSDVTKDTLVSASTNAQTAAGSDRILDAAVGQFVGDRYLVWKTTAVSATPAAVTYSVFVKICIGILTYASGLKPSMTDAAI